jgi:hypothetical protein
MQEGKKSDGSILAYYMHLPRGRLAIKTTAGSELTSAEFCDWPIKRNIRFLVKEIVRNRPLKIADAHQSERQHIITTNQ